MLSRIHRTAEYFLVSVRNEMNEEEHWLLTEHDREVLQKRASRFAERHGPIRRRKTLIERFCSILRFL